MNNRSKNEEDNIQIYGECFADNISHENEVNTHEKDTPRQNFCFSKAKKPKPFLITKAIGSSYFQKDGRMTFKI